MTVPRLKKQFGQHHLVRADLCRPLLDFLEPAGHTVIEVGPGGGILTDLLLESSSQVTALELDPEWAAVLCGKPEHKALRLAVADAMDVQWHRVRAGTLITGNLPYEIASALIRRLLPHHALFPRLAFLIQREVAERFVAQPGTKAYGLLSILAAAWSDTSHLGTVARGSFRPPPKVEGSFIGFRLKPPPLADDEMPAFVRTVELAFSQRRKTVRNALASGWGRELAEAVLFEAGIELRSRAEELDLAGFVALHRAFVA